MKEGNNLLKSRVLWTVVGSILLVPMAISNGPLYLVLTIVDIGILTLLLLSCHRKRNDGIRSAASSLILAVLAIASWKHRWTVQLVVCSAFSLGFGAFAISEMRSRNRQESQNGSPHP
jgi:hypothetical protein